MYLIAFEYDFKFGLILALNKGEFNLILFRVYDLMIVFIDCKEWVISYTVL